MADGCWTAAPSRNTGTAAVDRDTALDFLAALDDREFADLTAARSDRRRSVPPGLNSDDLKAVIVRELNRNPEENI